MQKCQLALFFFLCNYCLQKSLLRPFQIRNPCQGWKAVLYLAPLSKQHLLSHPSYSAPAIRTSLHPPQGLCTACVAPPCSSSHSFYQDAFLPTEHLRGCHPRCLTFLCLPLHHDLWEYTRPSPSLNKHWSKCFSGHQEETILFSAPYERWQCKRGSRKLRLPAHSHTASRLVVTE